MSGFEDKIRDCLEQTGFGYVRGIRSFTKGHNAKLFLIDNDKGDRLVAKIAESENARLDIEGFMLGYLKERSDLPVPECIIAQKDILIMSYIPSSGVVDGATEQHAADLLASLHNIRGRQFGFERDTLIGPYEQPNTPSSDWISFFRDQRLLYMAKKAFEEKAIDKELMSDIERLCAKLSEYITSPSMPSLLHGDVWSGNILSSSGKVTGFIDPAIYYGDPEIELAFTTLFGTFSDYFFDRYFEHHLRRSGFFEVRCDLYKLYPLLVHARLFGKSYAKAAKQSIARFI